ncbi:MAG: GNAT family N-acetyltransferase [Bacillota bacterium]
MEIRIVSGTIDHLPDCKEALRNSQLGEVYYTSDEILTSRLAEGMTKGEIHVALDENNQCLGYIWIALRGAFYDFPYCRSLAVRKDCRGRGVGTALLEYYEKVGFAKAARIFMLVSDFNERARKLYESLGYRQVGLMPDLFKEGVAEFILMKAK